MHKKNARLQGKNIGRVLVGLAVVAGISASQTAVAAEYPSQPIRLIVGSSAGGGGDTTARLISDGLSRTLGETIIVENRPGASGNIGAMAVARANPDGYMLLFAYTGHVINPALLPEMPFDPEKDFRSVGKIGENQSVLIVNPKLDVSDAKDLIEKAKANPKKYTMASMFGTDPYMTAKQLAYSQKVDFLFVPYKGNGQAMTDVVSGQVDGMVNTLGVSAPYVQSGQLRALAVTSKTRSSLLPDVPTLEEAGISGVASDGWYGVLAPAGVPDDVISKLSTALETTLKDPEMQESLRKLGVEPSYVPPAEFDAFIQSEIPRLKKVVAETGITSE